MQLRLLIKVDRWPFTFSYQ